MFAAMSLAGLYNWAKLMPFLSRRHSCRLRFFSAPQNLPRNLKLVADNIEGTAMGDVELSIFLLSFIYERQIDVTN